MPEPNIFDDFRFPEPVELEPLEPYKGTDANFGGFEEAYGGDYGNLDRVIVPDAKNEEGPYRRAFQPYALRQNSVGTWSCFITEGIVLDTHIRNEGADESSGRSASRELVPLIGGTPIIRPCDSYSIWERPELSLGANPVGFIYIHFCTDDHGWIGTCSSGETEDAVVRVVFKTAEEQSTHHKPQNFSGTGVDGDYYFLIGKICLDSHGEPEIIHKGHQSNVQWQEAFVTEDWSGGDLSEDFDILNGFSKDKDAFKMRRVRLCYALEGTETEKRLTMNWLGDNCDLGDITPAGPQANIYIDSGESCGGKARFRALRQGLTATRQQIKIEQGDCHVVIQGNDVDGELAWQKCDSTGDIAIIKWEDGLITTAGRQVIKAGCDSSGDNGNGIDGSITFLDCDSAVQATVTWQNGMITTAGNQFFKAGCDSSGAADITSIVGGYGITSTEANNEATIKFDGANAGSGVEVYVDSAGVETDTNQAKFRVLAQTTQNVSPQIAPTKVGKSIEIRGNNIDGKLRIFDGGAHPLQDDNAVVVLEWKDGLIITSGTNDYVSRCDSSGAWEDPSP